MFSVYIIYSNSLDRYYVGHSSDVCVRLNQHNGGYSKYISKASDWELRYTEQFPSREEAHKRELEIKRKKSRKYIEWLVRA